MMGALALLAIAAYVLSHLKRVQCWWLSHRESRPYTSAGVRYVDCERCWRRIRYHGTKPPYAARITQHDIDGFRTLGAKLVPFNEALVTRELAKLEAATEVHAAKTRRERAVERTRERFGGSER